jgi:hypothetical protein
MNHISENQLEFSTVNKQQQTQGKLLDKLYEAE